jgi:outer membrane lipoprotein LolB
MIMMRQIVKSVMLAGCLFLTACAALQPATLAPQNAQMSWDARVASLSQLQNWDLNALIATRNQTGNNSATLRWQQGGQQYTFSVFGPMGTAGFKLTGRPGHVTLENARGQTFTAASPEQLLAQQTGVRLPVSNLYYWIRGLPVPGIAAQKQLDVYNHLVTLTQAGWKIEFLRYTATHHVDLPSKIFISSQALGVKIIISQWQLN